jgi:hypothetical protein
LATAAPVSVGVSLLVVVSAAVELAVRDTLTGVDE